MREVTVSRTVGAPPYTVERALSPAKIVEYEGSFSVEDVTETDGETVVSVAGRGLGFALRFTPREDGWEYRQEGGPLARMETTLTYEPTAGGTQVEFRSAVHMGYPPAALFDRVAAWKRQGELKRALASLAADVE